MTSTMKALRFHGKRDLRLEDIPIPEVKEGQVKVNSIGISPSERIVIEYHR
jgi:threonine dehydrogenase-like Zn-dependent dehydrogenase